MTDQVWNFPIIHATLDVLHGQATAIQAGNEHCTAELGRGQAAWEGAASDMWAHEQTRFNGRAEQFKSAVTDYINAVRQATHGQEHTENQNMSSFC